MTEIISKLRKFKVGDKVILNRFAHKQLEFLSIKKISFTVTEIIKREGIKVNDLIYLDDGDQFDKYWLVKDTPIARLLNW